MLDLMGKRTRLPAAVSAALLVALVAPASASPAVGVQEEFPTMAGEARRYYENQIEDWTDGPAEMLMTVDEREIWGSLEDIGQKERFIEWFWARRDPDGRAMGNAFQEEFYENIAFANERFRGFPRGWKSDRGRVRGLLGRPDGTSRQTWGMIFGGGNGPDFEVWSYSNLGNNRAFQASGGEFLVYFVETRIGQYEIYDYRWGPGVWDRNIRLAFEIVIEASIIDPIMEFEAGEARGDFVREITEGTLPVEVPVDIWADLGAGGMVSAPVQIKLGDLLFQPDGDFFVARLDATLQVEPASGGSSSSASAAWEVRLAEQDLLELGNGSFVTAITTEAAAGASELSLVVSHPLAASDAEWTQTVQVGDAPGASIVVGKTVLPLSSTDPSSVAILMAADESFEPGGALALGAWIRGEAGDPDALSIQLEAADGAAHVLEIEEVSWLQGAAGPLTATARIPQLEAGEYVLRVDFGAGRDAASTNVQIGG